MKFFFLLDFILFFFFFFLVTKQRDPGKSFIYQIKKDLFIYFLDTKQQSLLFQIDYPEISDNIVPKHRFMSGFEQHVEAPDRRWQYLLFAAEPYETIAFKVIFIYFY